MFQALQKAVWVQRQIATFQLFILYPTLSNTWAPATCGYGVLKHGKFKLWYAVKCSMHTNFQRIVPPLQKKL